MDFIWTRSVKPKDYIILVTVLAEGANDLKVIVTDNVGIQLPLKVF
jgi:hypothetical protein